MFGKLELYNYAKNATLTKCEPENLRRYFYSQLATQIWVKKILHVPVGF